MACSIICIQDVFGLEVCSNGTLFFVLLALWTCYLVMFAMLWTVNVSLLPFSLFGI